MKNITQIQLGILAAAMLLVGSRSEAALSIWTDAGTTWSGAGGTPTYYNPDVSADANFYDKLPSGAGTAPAWSNYAISGSVSSATVVGNYLQIATDKDSMNAYTINSNWGFQSQTIETRVRIDSVATGAIYAATMFMGANGKGISLSLTPTGIVQFGTVLVATNLTQWTVIRMTIAGGATPTLNLYINNNPVAAYTSSSLFYNTTNNFLGFGDASSSSEGGVTQWDYIRWTDTGAFAPIPEPGTWALLSIAGAMAAGWRRRRA